MIKSFSDIGVVGAGAWGTSLGLVAIRAGLSAKIWAREIDTVNAINDKHRNPFLADVDLDPALTATAALAQAAKSDALLLAVPAQYMRSVCSALAPHLIDGTPVVICTKGIEQNSGALMSEVVSEALPGATLAVLSGPTLATEVAAGLPTAVTLACGDPDVGKRLIQALGSPSFRPYGSSDMIGAQIGGATKNVFAIASGIVSGREIGEDGRAAVITRGMAELMRLGRKMGAQANTLMGLSGMGDLVLTCTSPQSRNQSLGVALGRGQMLGDILGERASVAEGVFTASAAMTLAEKLGIEMPLCAAVDAIVNHGKDIGEVIHGLLSRPFRSEAL
jgi:glycerol-3-phosphate dehydrogenase (NAD(P)+)